MKLISQRVHNASGLFFTLLFALVFALAMGTDVSAKEKKRAGGKRSTGSLAKTSGADVITPFDGNRIYNYIVNDASVASDNVGGSSGFFWPSVPRTSRSQTEDDLRGANAADYSSGLWIVGTVAGEARSAISEYTSEYIAGKVLPDGTRDDATLDKYRNYKIIKGDGPGVADYDQWPAADGAPTNPDGTPRLIGDQTIWNVVNDLDETRHQGPISGSLPIGLEVQSTVFGFNRADALGDIMFVQWTIINKGTANLDSAFIGVWDDPDLGDASDDLVGCDTSLGLGFVYNGDPNDGSYGARTPAMGFDFFQGPEVPTGSGNYLKMTSFAKYTNGAPVGQGDPEDVSEVYNYMTGFWQDGSPIVDPTTGLITKFINAGDPVTRRGDLDFSPSDRRFLMSSGPFTLAVGDTQIVVGAKVIAPGANPSSSIAALRFFDSFAQSAFDNDFDIVNAPTPNVTVQRLDQEILLRWDAGAAAIESFNERGYAFQGYRVYQASSLTGPYTPIAVFDLADGLQNIFDLQFDETSGLVVEAPVVVASDAGVQRYISITTDAIFDPNQRLANYRTYYLAVTAYVVNINATPKYIESPISTFRVEPSAPDYGTSISAEAGTQFNMTHNQGTGDGTFFYQVVDPTEVPSGSYTIIWNNDSTPEEGAYTYNVDRNGVRIASNVVLTGRDSEGNPNDHAPIFDGLQFQVLPATFSSPTTILGTTRVSDANSSLRLWGDATLFGGATGFYNEFGNGVPNPPVSVAQSDLEFRFTGRTAASDDNNDAPITEGGQWTTQWDRASFGAADLSASTHVQMLAPFELWNVETNQQVNFALVNRNADGATPYANGVGDPNTPGMEPRYRMTGRDYILPIMTPYDPATAATTVFAHNDPNTSWLLFFRQAGESTWNTGDVLKVRFANPTLPAGGSSGEPADTYTFTTAKSKVEGQAAITKAQLQKINVVPNPYWAFNAQETQPLDRLIRVTNLPGSGATIRIFNLAGDLVRVLDDADRRSDGTNGLQYANWDLRNDAGIPIASGIYIVHVEVPGVGTKVLKLVAMVSQDRLRVF